MKTKKESKNVGLSTAGGTDTAAPPAVVDRAAFQAKLDVLRVREKAHTREGDAIAAARRRLPMVEVDPTITLIGPHGPVTLLEVFEGLVHSGFHVACLGEANDGPVARTDGDFGFVAVLLHGQDHLGFKPIS